MNLQKALRLIGLYARVSVQNITAYRFDMVVRIFVSILHLLSELMMVWTMFTNMQGLRGWRWQHMVILVGVYRILAGGIRIFIVPNMRKVLEDIRTGALDFVLLRPVPAQFLVSVREVVPYRVVDVLLGASVAVFGCVKLSGTVSLQVVLLFSVMMAAAFVIVYSVWLMLATMCFWFVRIANIEMVFWNVFEAGRFPITIYRAWVQWTLTFIVPLAFITHYPAAALSGETKLLGGAVGISFQTMPLYALGLALVMLIVSNRFWRFGLRRYSGASA